MFATKFWEQIASGTGQKWTERILSPALLFWAIGLWAYAITYDWRPSAKAFEGLGLAHQIALVIGSLAIVGGSAAAVENVQQEVLRLLEGYWPSLLRPLQRYFVKRNAERLTKLANTMQILGKRFDKLTPEELETYGRCEAVRAAYPRMDRLLPTRLGNHLRAAEDYPWHRYRLATGLVWPRLWLLLPEADRKEIEEARTRLDAAVRLFVWSLLLGAWTPWIIWVLPVSALGMAWSYWRSIALSDVYADLLRAAFDIHRWKLYEALHWPLPENPLDERKKGMDITIYLKRGTETAMPKFSLPGTAKDA